MLARASLSGLFLCLMAFAATAADHIAAVKSDDGKKVTITIDGQPFAEYLTKSGSKPIVWPILGPTGKKMTRQWPMGKKRPGEKTDHPHQRSLWFSHGIVNGEDFWREPSQASGKKAKKDEKIGSIVHREFLKVASGDEATIVTRNDWLDPNGKKVCQDKRQFIFGGDENARWIDFDITIEATNGPVTFGDTKEGTMGIRVAAPLKPEAKKGGQIINNLGQTDEKAWGQRASWVDFSGPLDDERVGICVMNHPSSFRYPTYWHARTYGLCAANPFGVSDFERDKSKDGSYTIPKDESITLRYRILLHKGDAKSANLQEVFKTYAKQAEK